MSNQLLLDILSLADRIEADRAAVWEWFFRTPIWPHGGTAFELAQSGRGDEVIAFLDGVLRDSHESGANIDGVPVPRGRVRDPILAHA